MYVLVRLFLSGTVGAAKMRRTIVIFQGNIAWSEISLKSSEKPGILTKFICITFAQCRSNKYWRVGGTVASWLVRSTPERMVRVQALAGDVVFLGKTLNSQSASLHPGV